MTCRTYVSYHGIVTWVWWEWLHASATLAGEDLSLRVVRIPSQLYIPYPFIVILMIIINITLLFYLFIYLFILYHFFI